MAQAWAPPTAASIESVPPEEVRTCPLCGRTVRADMMYDISQIPGARGTRGCDACREQLFRTNPNAKRSDYLEAHGAPAELVQRVRDRGE